MEICVDCQKSYEISSAEQTFLAKCTFDIGSVRFAIPPSKYCASCRRKIRTSHRNEQFLYRATSAKSGQPIIAIYSPDSPWRPQLQLYTHEEWWSDDWDPLDYGRDFDFSRPFFEQFYELAYTVPRVALVQVGNENCPYTTGTGYCKNCYLINCSENSEDSYYGKLLQTCRDVCDTSYAYDSELLYECFNVRNCYQCGYLLYSQNCTDCYFSENLVGCRNSFLSTNLRNKEYYFMNQQLSKKDYGEAIKKYLGSKKGLDEALKILNKMRKERIHKYANIINSENSTGDFMMNCQNCSNCFDCNDSQDCINVNVAVQARDCMDSSNMYLKPELSYSTLGTIGTYNVHFSLFIFTSQNILYSQFCYDSKNIFGCFGLRKKEYCIFNKQYTKEEYETLVPKIIAHMDAYKEFGDFFPMWMSPFAYNESVAYEYNPLTVEEAHTKNYQWREVNPRENKPQTIIFPDTIQDTPESIVSELLACEQCGKNYKIIDREWHFLKKMNMPVPRVCPDCRHFSRLMLRNPAHLWERVCAQCQAPVHSTYVPDDSSIIYCENCYIQAL